MPEIIQVHTDAEYEAATFLFREYAAWLNIDLYFQNFDEELMQIKNIYTDPFGGIFLYKEDDEYIGCIAIRKLDVDTGELKRMYIRHAYQQKGYGNLLLQHALMLANKYNYKRIRLDTLSHMIPAINLYQKNGFREIPAYYYNPEPTAVFFEKELC